MGWHSALESANAGRKSKPNEHAVKDYECQCDCRLTPRRGNQDAAEFGQKDRLLAGLIRPRTALLTQGVRKRGESRAFTLRIQT